MNKPVQALPMSPVPDSPDAHEPAEHEFEPLLGEAFSSAWVGAPAPQATAAVRGRLLDRLAQSRAEAAVMFTARRRRLPAVELAPGVRARSLYQAQTGREPRPGEPLQARLIELDPGSHWAGPTGAHHREWLLLRGAAQLGRQLLQLRDYHVAPAGSVAEPLRSDAGAWLFLRESTAPAGTACTPFTVLDSEAGWPDFVPGIQRRVLWQHAGQAALLYWAQPGASVPLHTHGHDEECLMVQGELFLDDLLLQPGDYQLAPAGTGHRITQTDTGVVIYAHGDMELQFVT